MRPVPLFALFSFSFLPLFFVAPDDFNRASQAIFFCPIEYEDLLGASFSLSFLVAPDDFTNCRVSQAIFFC